RRDPSRELGDIRSAARIAAGPVHDRGRDSLAGGGVPAPRYPPVRLREQRRPDARPNSGGPRRPYPAGGRHALLESRRRRGHRAGGGAEADPFVAAMIELDEQQQRARAWFESLRDRICAAFEEIEREAGSEAHFDYQPW